MIVQGVTQSFLYELLSLQGIHMAGDEYRMALYTKDANLTLETTAYTTAGETVGPGYMAGGQKLEGFLVMMEQGVAFLDWADPVWPTTTITARAALIFNYTKANRSVAVLDLGKDYVSTNGKFTVVFPEPTPETALIAIGRE